MADFWTDNRNAITAGVTVLIALVLARLVDRYLVGRATKMASAVTGPLSPVANTRLRLVRRHSPCMLEALFKQEISCLLDSAHCMM